MTKVLQFINMGYTLRRSRMGISEKVLMAKHASLQIRNFDETLRNELLLRILTQIKEESENIVMANNIDIAKAKSDNLDPVLCKRLLVDENKLQEIYTMIHSVISQPDLLYKTILKRELAPNLILSKRYVPFGTIGMIFESRPDALIQMAILCLKTGNSVILKGGSEALETNKILYKTIVQATMQYNSDWIQLIESHADVDELIKGTNKQTVDIVIPRGSKEFVAYIMKNATMPVLGHADGVCHLYIHPKANLTHTRDVIVDAKLQYPAGCNALECVLVDDQALIFLPKIIEPLVHAGVKFFVDKDIAQIFTSAQIPFSLANEDTWGTEFSNVVLAIRTVDDVNEATEHINMYGSGHTDIIMTQDEAVARHFQKMVDSSSVLWNCSSRFADGYRYGLGAEVGVSTSKIHARGPVGIEGIFSTQWIVDGDGHTVLPFIDGTEKFTHKNILTNE